MTAQASERETFYNSMVDEINSIFENMDKHYTKFIEARISNLAVKHWYDFLLMLSGYYPLKEEMLDRYFDCWNWISTDIGHTNKTGMKFVKGLNSNCNLNWSIELIDKYKDKWSTSPFDTVLLQFNDNLLEEYIKKYGCRTLSLIRNSPWTIELIDKYEDKKPKFLEIDGKLFLVPDWIKSLSSNIVLPWSIELLDKYHNKWNWKVLSSNKSICWTIELIEKFSNKWDWEILSSNVSLPWSVPLIDKYIDKWDWWKLSLNVALPWSMEFVEKYKNKWFYSDLWCNEAIPWTTKYIEEKVRNYDIPDRFYKNKHIQWLDFVEKYESKINWRALSKYTTSFWTSETIEKYEKKIDWKYISENTSFPWALDILEKYDDKLDWLWGGHIFYDQVFRLYLSDSLIDGIMSEIKIVKKRSEEENEEAEKEENRRLREEYEAERETKKMYEQVHYTDLEYDVNVYDVNELHNPWEDVFGKGDEADAAYWNTD